MSDVMDAITVYLDARDALDNREYAGINGEPWEVLQRRVHAARRDLDAALFAQQGAEPARIDPMQNPMRPGYFMNYAEDETPAEMVLRKLACCLGVGGYNAPRVDADVFHRKIVDGIESLLASRPAAGAAQATGEQS